MTSTEHHLKYWLATHGLTAGQVKIISNLIYLRYGDTFMPVADQGGCSYTAMVSTAEETGRVILQFRISDFTIDIAIARDAARIFPKLAPKVIRCDLLALSNSVSVQAVEMSVVAGTKLADVMSVNPVLSEDQIWKLKHLLGDVADFFATSWYTATATADDNNSRRRSAGLIGSSISERLALLERDLPSPELRRITHGARRSFEGGMLAVLPVVLNHGDLLPCNILVDALTYRLTGLVDWAEAEYLPVGMTLYGVEHLLGYMDYSKGKEAFVYYHQADVLREFFWESLRGRVVELCRDELWQAVLLSRTIGTLLWHGIAWDEGRRDRVVEAQSDSVELSCLGQMLGIPRYCGRRHGLCLDDSSSADDA